LKGGGAIEIFKMTWLQESDIKFMKGGKENEKKLFMYTI
jgi:hypothetical protein